MPTDPLPSALDREVSKAEARGLIDLACPLFRELVNYGTNALQSCNLEAARGQEDEHVAALVLYRHIIEMTDGIEILLAEGSVTPALPLVRSSFEALLQLEYILEDPGCYLQRSLSWMLRQIYDRLAVYEMVDRTTQRGKQFRQAHIARADARNPTNEAFAE